MRGTSETASLVWPLIDAVNALPFCRAYRLHSGTAKVRGGYMRNNEIGTPDLMIIVRGVPVLAEAKKPDGRHTHGQREAADRARRAGAIVLTYTDLESVMKIVRSILRDPENAVKTEVSR